MRVGDPALMLLRPEAQFDPETESLIRADILRALPDPTASWEAPNGRLWIKRALLALAIVALAAFLKNVRFRRLQRSERTLFWLRLRRAANHRSFCLERRRE